MCAGCSHLPALESQSQGKADKTYFHSFSHSLQSRKLFMTAKSFSSFLVPVGCLHGALSRVFSVVKCHLVHAGTRITLKIISFASDLAFNNCSYTLERTVKSRKLLEYCLCCCWFTSTVGCCKTGLSPKMFPIPTVPEMLFRKTWARSCRDVWGLAASTLCSGTQGLTALLVKTQRKTHYSFQRGWLEWLLCESNMCAGRALFAGEKKNLTHTPPIIISFQGHWGRESTPCRPIWAPQRSWPEQISAGTHKPLLYLLKSFPLNTSRQMGRALLFPFSLSAWVHSLPLGEPGSKTCQMHQNLPNKVPFTSRQSGAGLGACWERWVRQWLSGLCVANRVHSSQNNTLIRTSNSLEIKSLSWSGKTGAKEIKQCSRENLWGLMGGGFLWVCCGVFLTEK